KPSYDGLVIDPCLPCTAQEYSVKRKFRDAEYRIRVSNPKGVCRGIISMQVDGTDVEGNVIAYTPGNHEVIVVMG
ncbi:MAG: hypothetical protein IKX33_00390, partial [Prevotella sp.]|nr:hypothetical protein [Prevotella sp.]